MKRIFFSRTAWAGMEGEGEMRWKPVLRVTGFRIESSVESRVGRREAALWHCFNCFLRYNTKEVQVKTPPRKLWAKCALQTHCYGLSCQDTLMRTNSL